MTTRTLRRLSALVGMAALAGVAWKIFMLSQASSGLVVNQGRPAPTLLSQLQAPVVQPTFMTGMEHLPHSLAGTQPPPGLIIDAQGHLVITHGLRMFFDYFLSALGEEPLPTIESRVRAYMASSLPQAADRQAERIFHDYMNYLLALQKLSATTAATTPTQGSSMDMHLWAEQLQQKRQLRSGYLTPPVIKAFYGDEDAYDDYTLQRWQISQNTSLSQAEKTEQQKQLLSGLPDSVQQSMASIQLLQNVQQSDADCRKRGCSAEELHTERVAEVGEAAAERLDSMDADNAAWQQRVQGYLQQRQQILASSSYSPEDKQAQIEQLQAQQFAPNERLRLDAYTLASPKSLTMVR